MYQLPFQGPPKLSLAFGVRRITRGCCKQRLLQLFVRLATVRLMQPK